MYICSVANQKGGVGKTTTTQNLGAALARQCSLRVLLIDLDAQGNLTDACGINTADQPFSVYQMLEGSAPLQKANIALEHNMDLLPASIHLSVADMTFAGHMGRENLLKKALKGMESAYDVVLIDCPPSLGLLTVNALTASQGLLIPVQVEYHALAGLALMRQTVAQVAEHLNESLSIMGLELTFYDARKKLNRDVVHALENEWGNRLFQTKIRDNVSLAEAPSEGQDIHQYKRGSFGASDYTALATEFTQRMRRQ